MPLLPAFADLLERLAALGDPPITEQTPAEARALRRSRMQPSNEAVHDVRDVDAGGLPARLYRPSPANDLGLLVHFHGGGWVVGDLDTCDHLCRVLANRSGLAILSVDYRLAPEHPFPAAADDALAAVAWAHANARDLGADPARLGVSGESAGANLAAVAANRGVAPLRVQALICPSTDLRCDAPSFDQFAEGHLLTASGMRWFAAHYLGGSSAEHPDASPAFASDETLRAAAPAIVVTAECDVLRDEGEAYAARLAALDVAVTAVRLDGMIHNALAFAGAVSEADAALSALAESLRDALARS